MMSGTPVIATDIPGVRQPVLKTGMGKIVPPMDADRLADAVIEVIDNPERFRGDAKAVSAQYSPAAVSGIYEELISGLLAKK